MNYDNLRVPHPPQMFPSSPCTSPHLLPRSPWFTLKPRLGEHRAWFRHCLVFGFLPHQTSSKAVRIVGSFKWLTMEALEVREQTSRIVLGFVVPVFRQGHRDRTLLFAKLGHA